MSRIPSDYEVKLAKSRGDVRQVKQWLHSGVLDVNRKITLIKLREIQVRQPLRKQLAEAAQAYIKSLPDPPDSDKVLLELTKDRCNKEPDIELVQARGISNVDDTQTVAMEVNDEQSNVGRQLHFGYQCNSDLMEYGSFYKSFVSSLSSVGYLQWSNGGQGSAFPVGDKYVMTNYHVVKEIASASDGLDYFLVKNHQVGKGIKWSCATKLKDLEPRILVEVALQCLEHKPDRRPNFKSIIARLHKEYETKYKEGHFQDIKCLSKILKLGDFGVAKLQYFTAGLAESKGPRGTISHVAPELFSPDPCRRKTPVLPCETDWSFEIVSLLPDRQEQKILVCKEARAMCVVRHPSVIEISGNVLDRPSKTYGIVLKHMDLNSQVDCKIPAGLKLEHWLDTAVIKTLYHEYEKEGLTIYSSHFELCNNGMLQDISSQYFEYVFMAHSRHYWDCVLSHQLSPQHGTIYIQHDELYKKFNVILQDNSWECCTSFATLIDLFSSVIHSVQELPVDQRLLSTPQILKLISFGQQRILQELKVNPQIGKLLLFIQSMFDNAKEVILNLLVGIKGGSDHGQKLQASHRIHVKEDAFKLHEIAETDAVPSHFNVNQWDTDFVRDGISPMSKTFLSRDNPDITMPKKVLEDHFYHFRPESFGQQIVVVCPALEDYFERMVTEPSVPREDLYCCEAFRLQSFLTFPRDVLVGAVLLAKAGFWYTGTGDEVVCFSCNLPLNNWMIGQNPFTRHQQASPECDYVNGREERNVPLGDYENPFSLEDSISNRDVTSRDASSNHSSDQTDFPPEVDPIMRVELTRVRTYTGWPASAPVFPDELASNGFYYTGSEDRVKCAFCAVVLRDWEPGDRVANEHRSHFPMCVFVRDPNNPANGNIPLGAEVPADLNQQPINLNENAGEHILNDPTNALNLGINIERPKAPYYSMLERRLTSFNEWPPNHSQSKQDLAEAGFYFIGHGDNVKCFFCDGGLRNWEPQDDPMTEHARWFPRCNYVREKRGDDFIRGITEHYDHFYPETRQIRAQDPAVEAVVNISGSGSSAAVTNLPGVEYTVEPREIKARMDTDKVRTVMKMGYSRHVIKQALENRLRTTGDDFPSSQALMEAIFQIEEGGNNPPPLPSQGGATARDPTAPSKPPATMAPHTAVPAPHTAVPAPRPAANQGATARPPPAADKPKPAQQPPPAATKEPVKKVEKPPPAETEAIEKGDRERLEKETERTNSGSPLESTHLVEENRYLKEQRQCKICMDNEVNVVFLPCGHLVCCQDCGLSLRNCPICRSAIRGTVKTFMS